MPRQLFEPLRSTGRLAEVVSLYKQRKHFIERVNAIAEAISSHLREDREEKEFTVKRDEKSGDLSIQI